MSLNDEIKKAVGNHGMWKKRLKNTIDTGKINVQISAIKADTHCNFGKNGLMGQLSRKKKRILIIIKKCESYMPLFMKKASKVAQLAISGHKQVP